MVKPLPESLNVEVEIVYRSDGTEVEILWPDPGTVLPESFVGYDFIDSGELPRYDANGTRFLKSGSWVKRGSGGVM